MKSVDSLRFTGENPPQHLLTRFPNWEFAQDEEAVDGQDETTIRPEGQQSCISTATAYTAGVIGLASNAEMPALIAIIGGRPESFWVYDEAGAWCLSRNAKHGIWEPFVELWLPVQERCRSVQLSNADIFPVGLVTRLPFASTGVQWQCAIGHDGRGTSD
jgi:hypothetical protein